MRHARLIASLICLTTVLSIGLAAQQPQVLPAQLEAQHLLYALYPELRSMAIFIDQQPTASGFRLRVSTPPAVSAVPQPSRVLLTVDVDVDGGRTLRGLRSGGELVRESSNRALAGRLRGTAPPAGTLTAASLPFGPSAREQVLAALPLAALRGPAGTAEVRSVTPIASPSANVEPAFYWRAEVLIRRPGVPDEIQTLDLEPFEARVVRMTRREVR